MYVKWFMTGKKKPEIFKQHDHEGRTDLVPEHPLTDGGQAVGALVFLAVWGLDSFVLKWTTFLSTLLPLYIRIPAAVPLLALAVYMARTGLRTVFQEVREPPVVIDSGVFAWVRHPVYLSEPLLYLGLFLLSPSLAALGSRPDSRHRVSFLFDAKIHLLLLVSELPLVFFFQPMHYGYPFTELKA